MSEAFWVIVQNALGTLSRDLVRIGAGALAAKGLLLTEDQQAKATELIVAGAAWLIVFVIAQFRRWRDRQKLPVQNFGDAAAIRNFTRVPMILLAIPLQSLIGCSPFYPGSAYVETDNQRRVFVDPYLVEAQTNHPADAQQIQDVRDTWKAAIDKARARQLWPWEK